MVGPGHTQLERLLSPTAGSWAHSVMAVTTAAILGGGYGAAMVGLTVALRRRDGGAVALLLVPMVFYLLISAGPQMYARFRVPVAPLICVLAGVGAVRIGQLMGGPRDRAERV